MAEYTEEIALPTGEVELAGNLAVPPHAAGLVLFIHGSGSSRFSPRNRYVAGALNEAGMATLLFDLLTREEEREDQATGHLRFNIPFLAARVRDATDRIAPHPSARGLRVGYFGASTGAAAALVAAVGRDDITAIVSRGGRPDLAGEALPQVKAPTRLIVGSSDRQVIDMNRSAQKLLRVENDLVIVPGAGHLFEEPGTLEEVARLAAEWFEKHFGAHLREAA